jgi:hypothetical protein
MGTSGALAMADALRINTSITHLVMDLERVGKEEVSSSSLALRCLITHTPPPPPHHF